MIWSIWEESISKNMKNDVVLSFCWGVRHVIILNSQKMTFKNWWVFFRGYHGGIFFHSSGGHERILSLKFAKRHKNMLVYIGFKPTKNGNTKVINWRPSSMRF